MKYALSVVFLISLAGCTTRDDYSEGMTDREAILDIISTVEAANNSGDVDTWVAAFDEDFVYMPSFGRAVTQQEELVEIAVTGFSSWKSNIEIDPKKIEIGQDWAFAYSEVRGNAVSTSGLDTVNVDV